MRLEAGASRVYLKRVAKPRKRAGDPVEFVLVGEKFRTIESARAFGSRLKVALAVFCAREAIGLNAGRDLATSSFAQHVKDMLHEKFNVQLRDDVHGLDVYREHPPVQRFRVSATLSTTCVIRGYEQALTTLLKDLPALSETQMLALELYNLTHFGLASRARFIALVTVVEALARPVSKSAQVRALVKLLQSMVQESTVSAPERRELCDGLGRLKTDSISSACRKLIAQLVNLEESRYFNDCYKTRSDLLHKGETKRTEPDSPDRLDELVRKLLLAHIGAV
jgi:hypothetical protein